MTVETSSDDHNHTECFVEAMELEVPSIPPIDHGYPLAFGVFQEYYTADNDIEGSSGAIASIGTSLTGIMYLMIPLTFTLLTRYPRLRPYCGALGLVITISSLILSPFATRVWQLIASQRVLCAMGSGLLFSPTTLYLDEWFTTRKGMAYGTMWAGKKIAGVILPFVMQSLLVSYGPRTALRVWRVVLLVITAPLLFFLKPRMPNTATSSSTRRALSWNFLQATAFWMFQLGHIVQSFGHLLPSTYLASYARALGLLDITGTILIAIFNFASVPSALVIGMLGDHLSATTVILISSLGSAIGVLLFWGLSNQMAVLTIFAIIYGFFAGGFSSTWPSILRELKRENEGIDTGLILGLLLGGRGIGNVISGPISTALLDDAWSTSGRWGYSTEYGPVILFTGVTALFGGWGWMWKTWKQIAT